MNEENSKASSRLSEGITDVGTLPMFFGECVYFLQFFSK